MREGEGTPMLFSHANGFCAHMWDPTIARIDSAGSVVAPDLRGHGASSALEPTHENYAWEKYADDLLAVIDATGIGPVAGVGHSMGAAALVLAADAAPEKFTSLFLFEPIISPPQFAGLKSPLSDQARRRRDSFESREAARERLGSKAPFMFWAPEVFDLYLEFALVQDGETVRLACRKEIEAVNYEMGTSHGGWGALERLDIPVTFAAGSLSSREGPIATPPLAARTPNSRYLEFEDRTHFGPFEDPALCAAEIEIHLATCEA